ncbi:prephenate dehydrogenase/arogenate dehydrogenase family protein [Streptomyces sp. NPDC048751]|uniref:prephenate dehydrogenase/arogenate dehydrogenase family protein n=1 Tax=Streptomyces sp. NPDC048751 TaxID=3365591 RepID=UPI00372036E6
MRSYDIGALRHCCVTAPKGLREINAHGRDDRGWNDRYVHRSGAAEARRRHPPHGRQSRRTVHCRSSRCRDGRGTAGSGGPGGGRRAAGPSGTAVVASHQSRGTARFYVDVAGVKVSRWRELEVLGCDLATVVGGHPLVGRPGSGPLTAQDDLFDGRPWALVPTDVSVDDRPTELARLFSDVASAGVGDARHQHLAAAGQPRPYGRLFGHSAQR